MDKINDFAALVYRETKEKYLKFHACAGPEAAETLSEHASRVNVKPGKKYTKVDVGQSGKFMVVNETGEIFGIKAYGVIHKGHKYGTLATINNYYWGDYHPIRRAKNDEPVN